MPRIDAARPRQDWWAKSSAGLLLGFSLGIASGCLLLEVLHGSIAIDAQLAMWAVVPVWMTVFCTCYLFRTGRRAWLALGGLNLLAYGALFVARLPPPLQG